jgi:hypothetical protein
MKLIFQIPNKLYYIQNFLDYPTYKQLHHDVFRSNLINLKSTKNTWNPNLLKNYKNFPDRTDLIETYKPLQKLKILLNTNPFIKINYNEIKFVLHSMKDNSGINWHNDGIYQYGVLDASLKLPKLYEGKEIRDLVAGGLKLEPKESGFKDIEKFLSLLGA